MSFLHREIDRLARAMDQRQEPETYHKLRIAKAALEWAADPQRSFAPSDSIQNEQVRMSRVVSSPNEWSQVNVRLD